MRPTPKVHLVPIVLILLAEASLPVWAQATIPTELSAASRACLECHTETNRGIYQEWGASKHYRANVGCYECHQARKGDKDAFEHGEQLISVIVSPQDCARCHAQEVAQFSESHHAKAGLILGSLDNFLADVVEGDGAFYGGSALTVSGCKQCHGGEVEVEKDGSLRPTGWPNSGMGRLNPDGSLGACTACHQRHAFSAEQARRPEACDKCHLGPDHPQKEIYEESKHGIAYEAHKDRLNMDRAKWVLGEDYTAAPTCATCHMSAVRTAEGKLLPVTHDVGTRISWNNRPELSIRPEIADAKLGLAKMAGVSWDKRRAEMKGVCSACHTSNTVDNFYEQYDGVISLYNGKFAAPGMKLIQVLREHELMTELPFDEKVEWTWWEIWHHEGRRARHGVSMFAPDYTHWHGLYEVAKHFYTALLPELRTIAEEHLRDKDPKKAAGARALEAELKALFAKPEHAWFIGQMSAAEREKRKREQDEFKKRYIKGP